MLHLVSQVTSHVQAALLHLCKFIDFITFKLLPWLRLGVVLWFYAVKFPAIWLYGMLQLLLDLFSYSYFPPFSWYSNNNITYLTSDDTFSIVAIALVRITDNLIWTSVLSNSCACRYNNNYNNIYIILLWCQDELFQRAKIFKINLSTRCLHCGLWHFPYFQITFKYFQYWTFPTFNGCSERCCWGTIL